MRLPAALALMLLPLPALAHVGHLDAVDGHHHYLAAWALIGVIVGALFLIWSERRAGTKAKRARGPRA